jgi:hypothetical protein
MWINPKTGKGWTDEEEAAFAQVMAAGNLPRLPAIRLLRRFHGNLPKAIKLAKHSQEVRIRTNKRFKRRLQGQKHP